MSTSAPERVGSYEIIRTLGQGAFGHTSDVVLPTIAALWKVGDRIPILYVPERDYDAMIVAVE